MPVTLLNFLYHYPFIFIFITGMLGLVFMPLVLRVAKERNFVVKPNKRTSHVGAIPTVGGLDIFISFLIFYVIFSYNHLQYSHYLMAGVTLILMTGFIDDLIDLSAIIKLSGEILAGVFLIVFADIRITNLFGLFGIYELSLIGSYVISFISLVAITNALNLIDGVDGLASGLGMLYSLVFALYFQAAGDVHMAVLAYALIGSLAVFFLYNVFGGTRRKIFMGDSGSLLLGFMMSWFVFHFMQLNATQEILPNILVVPAAPAVAFCILFVPLFDTMRVMITRIKKKTSPFKPDKNHIHHLLLRTGLKHRQVTFVALVVSLLFIVLAFIGRSWYNEILLFVAFLLSTILMFILWTVLAKKSQKTN